MQNLVSCNKKFTKLLQKCTIEFLDISPDSPFGGTKNSQATLKIEILYKT